LNYTFTQHVQCEYCVSTAPGLQVLKSQHTNMAFGGLCVEKVMHVYINGK